MCVSAATFGLGSLSVAVEVYRARAINIQLCSVQLTCNVEAVEIFHADA